MFFGCGRVQLKTGHTRAIFASRAVRAAVRRLQIPSPADLQRSFGWADPHDLVRKWLHRKGIRAVQPLLAYTLHSDHPESQPISINIATYSYTYSLKPQKA